MYPRPVVLPPGHGFFRPHSSFQAFSKAIAEYIDYYNNSRIQAKTKWMPPL
ncbi:IS3 family transposase [Faecalibacterium prausnitzii]|uniref:IS3 family transposase n=1 Tax=Faecalibacterium prausnitzii TaxID=853 RepID=UPI0015CF2517